MLHKSLEDCLNIVCPDQDNHSVTFASDDNDAFNKLPKTNDVTFVIKLATIIEKNNPMVAKLLRDSILVDNLGDFDDNVEIAKNIFAKVGNVCNGWMVSGPGPPESVSNEKKLRGMKLKRAQSPANTMSQGRSAAKDVSVHGGSEVESERCENSWLKSNEDEDMLVTGAF